MGSFADPNFPPPTFSVWEEVMHPWLGVATATEHFSHGWPLTRWPNTPIWRLAPRPMWHKPGAGARTLPLYAARIEELGSASWRSNCAARRHTALLVREANGLALRAKLAPAFLSRLGLCPRHKVLDLKIGCGVEIAVREVAPPRWSRGESRQLNPLTNAAQKTASWLPPPVVNIRFAKPDQTLYAPKTEYPLMIWQNAADPASITTIGRLGNLGY
jgi:hypothetical protein